MATVANVEEFLLSIKQRASSSGSLRQIADVSDYDQVPHSTVKKSSPKFAPLSLPYLARVETERIRLRKALGIRGFDIRPCTLDPNFSKTALWTDETHFFLDGHAYPRNYVISNSSNPHVINCIQQKLPL